MLPLFYSLSLLPSHLFPSLTHHFQKKKKEIFFFSRILSFFSTSYSLSLSSLSQRHERLYNNKYIIYYDFFLLSSLLILRLVLFVLFCLEMMMIYKQWEFSILPNRMENVFVLKKRFDWLCLKSDLSIFYYLLKDF